MAVVETAPFVIDLESSQDSNNNSDLVANEQAKDNSSKIAQHTSENPFNCDHCDEKFVLKEDLRVHERIHTREKTFKCHNCDKTFVQKDDLRVHERLHTGEKHYSNGTRNE